MNGSSINTACRRWAIRLVLAATALGCPVAAGAEISLQLVSGGLDYLVGIERTGDASGRLFLVQQSGQIKIYDGTHVLSTPFLDLSSIVTFGGEQGLLGLAFHPNYSTNGLFFVNYINRSGMVGDTVIARYHVSADPNVADPASATILLTVSQPFANHNGGQIRFGPDGFLYIALGDGGSGGDPSDNGQSLNTLLGKLLRIDVDGGVPYAIPPGNPFVNTLGARGEIWAYGLRNPWRFSFDRQTGDLFIGDVGQNLWEEVDVQPAGSPGGQNYGWRLMEGRHCYLPSSNCNSGSLTLPIIEYSHTLGCSITGGFRYRGGLLNGYAGTYFFSDLCGARIWTATPTPDGTWSATVQLQTSLVITTFSEDAAGELYVSHYGVNGGLYRIVSAVSSSPLLTVTKNGGGSGRISTSPLALECGSVCGARFDIGSAVTLTATADSGSTFVGWTGDPGCVGGAVTMSADRSCTATFGPGFTDDPIVNGLTTIKAAHVVELRSHVDSLRTRAGLSPFGWSELLLVAGSTPPKAIHIVQLRTALNQVYASAGLPPPSYGDPGLAAGDPIKAVHIMDLRRAILTIE